MSQLYRWTSDDWHSYYRRYVNDETIRVDWYQWQRVGPRKSRRSDRKRWRRAFGAAMSVAGDALDEGNRPLAIAVLCQMVHVDDAVLLTAMAMIPDVEHFGDIDVWSLATSSSLDDVSVDLEAALEANRQFQQRLQSWLGIDSRLIRLPLIAGVGGMNKGDHE